MRCFGMRLLGGVAILAVLPAGLLAALYWVMVERQARAMLAKRVRTIR